MLLRCASIHGVHNLAIAVALARFCSHERHEAGLRNQVRLVRAGRELRDLAPDVFEFAFVVLAPSRPLRVTACLAGSWLERCQRDLAIQRHVIQRTGSTAIGADALHYRSDLLLNLSIIIALLLAQLGVQRADALFGLGIALFIGFGAVQIGRQAVQILMDRELPDAVRAHALQIARSIPGVLDIHDLRTRESGQHWFMQLHLELPADLTLAEAHARGEQVRLAIVEHYPQAEVLVHKDPG